MHRKLLYALCLSLLPLVLFFFAIPSQASTTINVNSTDDAVNFTDGKCTLREAIIIANTDAALGSAPGECPAGSGADTIILPAGTYTLTRSGPPDDNSYSGDLDITQTVTIQGHGPADTIIHQSVAERVLEIFTPATVTLLNLTIDHGNDTICGGGGGIFNHSNLILMNVKITSNYSICAGGGLLNAYAASADLTSVSFISNTGVMTGGAIYNVGTLTFTRGLLSYDHAGFGAGIANEVWGSTTVISSVIMAENANFGGGIYNLSRLSIFGSSVNSNYAYGGVGGGILNETDANVWLTNVTLSSNLAISDTLGVGGGLFASGDVTLTNVTVADNFATTFGGGIFRVVSLPAAVVRIRNSILSSNTSATDGNCNASLTSLGYNLDSANTCALLESSDMTNTNPLLGSLSDNGGGTLTHALGSSSPAINKIPLGLNSCPNTDQRGYVRVGLCDIGAFEYSVRSFFPLILR